MKFRYKKQGKINFQGKQYKQGDIIDTESLGSLPGNWFETIETIEEDEEIEPIVRKTKKPKKEEVEENGDIESTNENLVG